jgi:Mannosylglycerate hydrolase MGH1-like glycoside hydrolase domain
MPSLTLTRSSDARDEYAPQPDLEGAEELRLEEDRKGLRHWKRWGPYLSERAWGTVREDYSRECKAWDYFTHDQARSRAYRWNEDGLGGISDRHQRICFALALWNERDPILKERLFGLTGDEGNHGEDVKEYYFYLDSTPTHSYMKWLYKYPQAAFPYGQLVEANRRRGRSEGEFELVDTGVFDESRYFDVFVEYAKGDPEDILIEITAVNRGPDPAPLHLLPTIWFRNTWSWGGGEEPPMLGAVDGPDGVSISIAEPTYGERWLHCEGAPELLFTDNESNRERLFAVSGPRYAKDGINDAVVDGRMEAINLARRGTKGSAHVHAMVPAGGQLRMRLRLTDKERQSWREGPFGPEFSSTFQRRRSEADAFYARLAPASDSEEARRVMRQAFAGLLWSKQYYHYVVKDWLDGDPNQPPPPTDRRRRNAEWTHLYAADVISMPDKWEYPWYAAWDLAFHCVPLALIDSEFAKAQLVLMLREWYMHPNGQLSAYEWAFGDVNPPVHAWAAWRVYKIEKRRRGVGDRVFLERVFQKLLLNFTWWVNRKDAEGRNVFEGGFLGLDNIGVFNRSEDLPSGGRLEQSDGTSWMAMYSLNMMAISLELADGNPAFEDMASKFWEHFLYIVKAMRYRGGQEGLALWNEEDGFFYDVLHLPNGRGLPIKARSMVGLIPLLAVETLEPEHLERLPAFKRRLEWFVGNRADLTTGVTTKTTSDAGERRLLSILDPERLRRVLAVMLDEREFLSPYGVRALSRIHQERPYVVTIDGTEHRVDYEPGESTSGLFGGNSNWRGPVWFPVNFLLIESLQKFHHYLGDEYTVECPTGSGRYLTLWEVAADLSRRLQRLFVRDDAGRRASVGNVDLFQTDPHWRDLLLFHEYFHADTGAGLGASHQTGWTALVAKLLQQTDVN